MAVDNPLITRQSVFGAKVETTTGTAIALADGDGAMHCFDVSVTPDITSNRREGQSSLSQLPAATGARAADISLRTELTGSTASGGTAPWADTLLVASGFKATGAAYTPETGGASATTLTCGHYMDGVKGFAAGCVFDWEMGFEVGNPVSVQWTGRGKWQVPVDASLLAPTFPSIVPPRFAGATMTIGGTAFKISRMSIACNNEIVLREDDSDATGYKAGVVVNRDIVVTVDPEMSLLATKDWFADWVANTELALSCLVGSITIAAPKMQLRSATPSDRNGIRVAELTFQCNRSAVTGDDELSITFG